MLRSRIERGELWVGLTSFLGVNDVSSNRNEIFSSLPIFRASASKPSAVMVCASPSRDGGKKTSPDNCRSRCRDTGSCECSRHPSTYCVDDRIDAVVIPYVLNQRDVVGSKTLWTVTGEYRKRRSGMFLRLLPMGNRKNGCNTSSDHASNLEISAFAPACFGTSLLLA